MIYVDESIQHELGYICVAFAYCESSPDEAISSALIDAGLTPGVDEYKSGARMAESAALHSLRERIAWTVLEQCKLGVYIAHVSERPNLLRAVSEIAEKIVLRNNLQTPQTVLVDQGILGQVAQRDQSVINLIPNCDSKKIFGIQLADYVAYHCSYLLKAAITGHTKTTKIEESPHPLTGEEVDLDWILRTEMRRNFFVEYRNPHEIVGDDWFFKLAGYGAFFSPALAPGVLRAAQQTFNSMYFGCVW